MKKYSIGMVLILGSMSFGCATIVKSDRTTVQFTGGMPDGSTQIALPDGNFQAAGGQATILVSRSKDDIPISVTCNNVTKTGVLKTSYDPLAGIAGNIVFGGLIGIGIDLVGNKAYDPPKNFNLAPFCAESAPANIVESEKTAPRTPSSR